MVSNEIFENERERVRILENEVKRLEAGLKNDTEGLKVKLYNAEMLISIYETE